MDDATTSKKKRVRDNKAGSEEWAKFVKRLLRVYHRRALEAKVDITSLEQLADIRRELDEQTAETVMALRGMGYSWAAIGDALGMTRAAAYNKYKGRPGLEDPEGARKVGGQSAL